MHKKTALLLAAFGAARLQGLKGIMGVVERVGDAFPGARLELAFTSNLVRGVWRRRREDPAWRKAHPDLPAGIFEVRGVLGAAADLQEQGWRNIIVQSLHIFAGEEYRDLQSYVHGLASIRTIKPRWRPFEKLALGRPALGEPGERRPYQRDLERAARALEPDVRLAREREAALVYVGHGNRYFSTGVYQELESCLGRTYPGVDVLVGVVEGVFGLEHVLDSLRRRRCKRVVLKPLMTAAGGHARDDMCGDEAESWKARLEAAGLDASCILEGLGENPRWADIYVEHIRDAAEDHGLEI